MGLRNVHLRFGDGTEGWPDGGLFDRILIAAGAPEVPRKLLLSQLKEGGIAVLPHGPDDEQVLVRVVRRQNDDLHVGEICACRFVKLIGREGWSEK
jgi:protein-L-isoaspartate(D-aspartate) O-methyltransferase